LEKKPRQDGTFAARKLAVCPKEQKIIKGPSREKAKRSQRGLTGEKKMHACQEGGGGGGGGRGKNGPEVRVKEIRQECRVHVSGVIGRALATF